MVSASTILPLGQKGILDLCLGTAYDRTFSLSQPNTFSMVDVILKESVCSIAKLDTGPDSSDPLDTDTRQSPID